MHRNDNPEHDPWETFLRGAEAEKNDKPQEAANLFKKCIDMGFADVPEPYFRLAAALFRSGDLQDAVKRWEEGRNKQIDVVGNAYHIIHQFQEEYGEKLPKWHGPDVTFQRAVAEYCIGNYNEARDAFKSDALTGNAELEEGLLFLASTARARGKEKAWQEKLEADEESCSDESCILLQLFREKNEQEIDELIKSARDAIDSVEENERLPLAFNLAIYYDAYANDKSRRDELLKTVIDGPKGDHEFLHYTANVLLKQ